MAEYNYIPTEEHTGTNGLCVAGFVVSLVSILCCGLTSIIGLILSIVGLILANKRGQGGKGMAIAGIIISALFTLLFLTIAIGLNILGNNVSNGDYEFLQTISGYEQIDEDLITDENWIEEHDGSYLVFEGRNSFKYYADANDLNDRYYEGTYEIYTGFDAFEAIVNDYSEYGIDESELTNLVLDHGSEGISYSNIVLLVLDNETCISDGANILEDEVITPYYGFLIEDDSDTELYLINMNAATEYNFTPED